MSLTFFEQVHIYRTIAMSAQRVPVDPVPTLCSAHTQPLSHMASSPLCCLAPTR